jgi:hypothetical protein
MYIGLFSYPDDYPNGELVLFSAVIAYIYPRSFDMAFS